MLAYIITAIVALLYIILVHFLGTWMHLQGSYLWILRIGLWVLGLVRRWRVPVVLAQGA